MNLEKSINSAADILRIKESFLLMTHKNPDTDAIGSMLALSKGLININKEVVSLSEEPLLPPLVFLKGSDKIVMEIDSDAYFEIIVVLDCSNSKRLGKLEKYLKNGKILINIDHHESNNLFGDINIVATGCSSTAELILNVIKAAKIPIDFEIAENIFAAIQSDTGCFKYENTNKTVFLIAAEMMGYGVKPWDVARKMIDNYSTKSIKLLENSLSTIEFYHDGKVAIMMLSSEMFKSAGAVLEDCEGLVDFPRNIQGVEVAVLIRQTGRREYKFKIRSNNFVNAARLAQIYGGGGHIRSAGFERQGELKNLKEDFLNETRRFLNGEYN